VKHSESIKEIASALSKAQSVMGGAKKGSNNPFFKSKYADLGAVIEVLREPFAANGLSYSQFPIFESGSAGVETILMHDSGEWMSSVLLLPVVKHDAQGTGSAITYARRYALQSIAGVPAEDDDGNAASQQSKTATKAKPVKKLSVSQQDSIVAALDMAGMSAEEFCKSAKIRTINELPASRFDGAMDHLKNKAIPV